jgi:hypothetical protein
MPAYCNVVGHGLAGVRGHTQGVGLTNPARSHTGFTNPKVTPDQTLNPKQDNDDKSMATAALLLSAKHMRLLLPESGSV